MGKKSDSLKKSGTTPVPAKASSPVSAVRPKKAPTVAPLPQPTEPESTPSAASTPLAKPGTKAKASKKAATETAVKAVKPAAKAVKSKAATKATKPKAKELIRPTLDDISLRAYFIAEARQRAGIAGDATSDWVQAEQELLAELNGTAKKAVKA